MRLRPPQCPYSVRPGRASVHADAHRRHGEWRTGLQRRRGHSGIGRTAPWSRFPWLAGAQGPGIRRRPRSASSRPLATTAPEKKRSAPFWIDASTVRIDKGVPIPGRGTKAIDWAPLLGQLAVGDSFLLPATAKSAIGTAMKAFKDSTGKTLASRKVDGGIRVWRIE